MASSSDQDGLASGLAEQGSRQVGTIAHWVSEREPGSLVGELTSPVPSRGCSWPLLPGLGWLPGG